MSKQSKRERQRLNREARRQAELAATKRRRQLRTGRNVAILAVPLVVLFVVLQLRSSGGTEPTRKYSKPPPVAIDPTKQYTATLDTSEGTIAIDLAASTAPTSVNSFVFLARHHFYDGLTFHRVAKDFVIQGGDPEGNGKGGPGYKIQGETPPNGYQVGSVAWAKGQQEPPGTAGSQFFIVTSQAPVPGQGLDALNQQPYQYGIIGTVTRGLEVAKKINALAPPSTDGKPTKTVTIKKVTITESAAPAAPPSS